MHDISRLSIYRQFESASKKQWAEAKSVYPFFIRLQDFIPVADVTMVLILRILYCARRAKKWESNLPF